MAEQIEQTGGAFGKAIADELRSMRHEMATKDELRELRHEMATKDELRTVETSLRGDIGRLEQLMLQMIDTMNANTRSVEAALKGAGVNVNLRPMGRR